MDKLPPLAKWAPKELVEMYSEIISHNKKPLPKNFQKLQEVLYRLGTDIDMKTCWEKLLSKEAILPKQELLGMWLITQIYMLLVEIFIRSEEKLTPQMKKKEIEKIIDLANKLIGAIQSSDEALRESLFTIQTQLSKEIIEKNPEKSRNFGFEGAPISSWSLISGVGDVFDSSAELKSLEPREWDLWANDKKALWLLSRLKNTDLTSILNTYLEQLKQVPSTYDSGYIVSNRATVTRKVFELFHKTYGDYMSACVVPVVNAILNLELGIEDIMPYKPKEKNI